MRTTIAIGEGTRAIALVLWLVYGASHASGQADSKWNEFVSPVGGYVAHYPSSWRLLDRDLPTLNIVNFPTSRQVKAVILPKNGAMIAVLPAPGGIKSIDDWIKVDGATRDQEPARMVALPLANAEKRRRVVEVVSDWGDASERSESVSCYFQISDRLLVARLTYWKGNEQAANFRQLLHELIRQVYPPK